MAHEPERPIEKLLRAAAKKRRDDAGAPFELHPATRRLLQGEVARHFAKPQRETRPFLSLLGQLWPRLAWSAAILTVLGVAVWTLVQMQVNHKQTTLLAKLEEEMHQARRLSSPFPPAPAAPAEAPAPPVAATPPGPVAVAWDETPSSEAHKFLAQSSSGSRPLAKEKLAPTASAEPADRQQASSAGVKAPASSVPPGAFASAEAAAGARYGLAATPVPPARAPAASALASDFGLALKEAGSARTVQRFVQLAAERETKAALADKALAPHPVLAAFDVEQDGRRLRITDGDGSVYIGYLQSPGTPGRALSLRTEAPASAPAARTRQAALDDAAQAGFDRDQSGPHTYSFHVTGTNRSLKQKVVFTGNFIARTNLILLPPAPTNHAVGGRLVDGRSDSGQPAILPLFNSRISGKAIIGSGQALDVNAWPSAR